MMSGRCYVSSKATSVVPSPLKSPATSGPIRAIRIPGVWKALRRLEGAVAVAHEDGDRIPETLERVIELSMATTRSSLPSPVKSPATIDVCRTMPPHRIGHRGSGRCRRRCPSNTDTVSGLLSRTARSMLPVAVKSPPRSRRPLVFARDAPDRVIHRRAGSAVAVAHQDGDFESLHVSDPTTARSRMPLPEKSPATMPVGGSPIG